MYEGYLLKIGTYVITGARYINYDSYEVEKDYIDLDPFRDSSGKLHRGVLPNVPIKITFSTRPNLTNADISAFFGAISANYTIPKERKCSVTAYVPETDSYVTQDMYMATPTFKIRHIDKVTNTITYDEVKVSLIGY